MEINEYSHLGDKIFNELEKSILDGTLKPGDVLSELKISVQMGVSRTPVREALRQLDAEQLVRNVPNKGYVVIGISMQDIEDIYTIRTYIEGLASRWAAEKISGEELERLREILELQEFYAAKNDSMQVWHLDSKFHSAIYACCRSHPLKKLLSDFHHNIQNARRNSLTIEGRTATAVAEHREIMEAIAAHNGEDAERLTKQHIINAQKNIYCHPECGEGI